jgi:hypothetical protein
MFNVQDAELVWQQPLSARARMAPLLVDDILLMADDHGVFQVRRAYNGDTLWENAIGHKEDPIQTTPYCGGQSCGGWHIFWKISRNHRQTNPRRHARS